MMNYCMVIAASLILIVSLSQAGDHTRGPAISVDPAFAFYTQRQWNETLSHIRKSGFLEVQIIDTGTSHTAPEPLHEIVTECRKQGVSPTLKVFPPTDLQMYQAHPEWRQRMLGGSDGRYDWRVFMCLESPEFVEAYCSALEEKVRRHQFYAVQLAEIWLEQWGGPSDGDNVRKGYACVCHRCVEQFAKATGANAVEMLTSPTSSLYFQRPENQPLYQQWVDFRVDSVTRFAAKVGAAVRRGSPEALLDLMILSDARVEPNKAREYQGIDLEKLLNELKPERVTIQDAWQDWLQPELKPDFIRSYGTSYVPKIRKLLPAAMLCSHADIGSNPASLRSPSWIREFHQESLKAGFHTSTYYEWSISRLARNPERGVFSGEEPQQ